MQLEWTRVPGCDEVSAQPDAAPPTAAGRKSPHNQFLDLVRTVAIIKVLAWHTYGFAWLSYLIASMPAMFFVAGSLMAHSLERTSVRKVLYARFRRLLIPLWAFGFVVLSGMILHSATASPPTEPSTMS